MVPLSYSEKVIHPKDSDPRPDIDKILDSIARDSQILNMPEKDKYWLKYGKSGMCERDINILNEYRKKFGMIKI